MPSGPGTFGHHRSAATGAGSPTPRSRRLRSSAHRSNHRGGPDVETSTATLVANRPRTILCVEIDGRVWTTLPYCCFAPGRGGLSLAGRRPGRSVGSSSSLAVSNRDHRTEQVERSDFSTDLPKEAARICLFGPGAVPIAARAQSRFGCRPQRRHAVTRGGVTQLRETYQESIPWHRWTTPTQGDLAGRSVEIL